MIPGGTIVRDAILREIKLIRAGKAKTPVKSKEEANLKNEEFKQLTAWWKTPHKEVESSLRRGTLEGIIKPYPSLSVEDIIDALPKQISDSIKRRTRAEARINIAQLTSRGLTLDQLEAGMRHLGMPIPGAHKTIKHVKGRWVIRLK